jgi:hypothetical protein
VGSPLPINSNIKTKIPNRNRHLGTLSDSFDANLLIINVVGLFTVGSESLGADG